MYRPSTPIFGVGLHLPHGPRSDGVRRRRCGGTVDRAMAGRIRTVVSGEMAARQARGKLEGIVVDWLGYFWIRGTHARRHVAS